MTAAPDPERLAAGVKAELRRQLALAGRIHALLHLQPDDGGEAPLLQL